MAEKKLVNFKVDQAEFERWDSICGPEADKRATSKSDLYRDGARLIADLSPRVFAHLKKLEKQLGVTFAQAINAHFLNILAHADAYLEVWESWPDRLVEPFQPVIDSTGDITPAGSERLFEVLRAQHLKQERARFIAWLEDEERRGVPLKPEEQVILDQFRAGKAAQAEQARADVKRRDEARVKHEEMIERGEILPGKRGWAGDADDPKAKILKAKREAEKDK